MGTLFLKNKVEQPYFLKYCKRNPALTYRHIEDFSTSLVIYRENDQHHTDLYMFQIKKESFDTTQDDRMFDNIEFDFGSVTYTDIIENAKDEVLDMCIQLEGDAILIRDKIKDDDPELFRDIFYIATLYLKIASQGKESSVKNILPVRSTN